MKLLGPAAYPTYRVGPNAVYGPLLQSRDLRAILRSNAATAARLLAPALICHTARLSTEARGRCTLPNISTTLRLEFSASTRSAIRFSSHIKGPELVFSADSSRARTSSGLRFRSCPARTRIRLVLLPGCTTDTLAPLFTRP